MSRQPRLRLSFLCGASRSLLEDLEASCQTLGYSPAGGNGAITELVIGSETHKEFFCRDFIASRQAYDFAQLPRPDLKSSDLQRLRAVSLWEEALHTERAVGAKVNAYTTTIQDPLLCEAVTLQGLEEAWHARMIQLKIQPYSITHETLAACSTASHLDNLTATDGQTPRFMNRDERCSSIFLS